MSGLWVVFGYCWGSVGEIVEFGDESVSMCTCLLLEMEREMERRAVADGFDVVCDGGIVSRWVAGGRIKTRAAAALWCARHRLQMKRHVLVQLCWGFWKAEVSKSVK